MLLDVHRLKTTDQYCMITVRTPFHNYLTIYPDRAAILPWTPYVSLQVGINMVSV